MRSGKLGLLLFVYWFGYMAGIAFSSQIKVKPLTRIRSEKIDEAASLLTYHFPERHLDSNLRGSFRFGATSGYRAQEGLPLGRLSDTTEGRSRTVVNARDGRFDNFRCGGIEIVNSQISSGEQLVLEVNSNDYCSCFSMGGYGETRAKALQDAEQDVANRPSAYVTYDARRLRYALRRQFRGLFGPSCTLVGRRVIYGTKDAVVNIPPTARIQKGNDELGHWLHITFMKPHNFQHEEEYRLLLVDRNNLGGLSLEEQGSDRITSQDVADCIVDHGTF